ncbi:hypothetical protein MUK70_25540 [Dyadobacter chenwenxiniae]|uniref:hypothetical protein n=1 Tax=Dyadobacter chenwenxiniae TaxID=2906456 RepID=UPI001FD1A17F|nr:hypothetical protein [Dyadobacter chenwenxiniae]UON82389.1 hypothetical protein MUK70_25540 [Dyadobacter chenwenxiniae]
MADLKIILRKLRDGAIENSEELSPEEPEGGGFNFGCSPPNSGCYPNSGCV